MGAVPGGWEVALADGEVLPASAVVVAAGGPAEARGLLPVDPGWPELGTPVTAACLDLGLARPSPFGGYGPGPAPVPGMPLPAWGPGAPGGLGGARHALRRARQALDRAELHRFATLAGVTEDQVVEQRFLALHVVTHVLPGPKHGLAGRPGVAVPGPPGLYLAGDWAGPSGWLCGRGYGQRPARRHARGPGAGGRPHVPVGGVSLAPGGLGAFEAERARLNGLAYRITGSLADAEDVVQEAWVRWAAENPPRWATRAVGSRPSPPGSPLTACGHSAAGERSTFGPWLPDPVPTAGDVEGTAELAESLTLPRLCVPPDELALPTARTSVGAGRLAVAVLVAHTFYALLMDIGPLGERELDWSAFG